MKARYLLPLATGLLSAPAWAQEASPPQPSPDEVVAGCNVEVGQLRFSLGNAQQQILTLRKKLAEATAKPPAEDKKDK